MGKKVNMLSEVLGDGMEEEDAVEVRKKALAEEDDAFDVAIDDADGAYDNP